VKALTLWQPWAEAIKLGLKQYETRSWATKYRGPLAIHASKRQIDATGQQLMHKYGIQTPVLGAIVLICDLTDCILMDQVFINQQSQQEIDWGDWQVGRYAWKLKNIRVLPALINAKGHQGFWNIDGVF
jgi:hypothetical protein